MTWWSQCEKHWQVWCMCAVHARSTDSVFGEVYSFVLSHGSYLTCRSHWLILPVMQSIPLAINSVIELIRTFPALMESERQSSSHLRHVFYPETNALSGRLRRSCFHWLHGLTSGPFFLWLYKTKLYVFIISPVRAIIAVILLLLPCPPLSGPKHSSQLPVIKSVSVTGWELVYSLSYKTTGKVVSSCVLIPTYLGMR